MLKVSQDEIITGILLLRMGAVEMFDYFTQEYNWDLNWSEFDSLYTLVKGVKL